MILGWVLVLTALLFFIFKLFNTIKLYITSLEARVELLEEHTKLLSINSEDCEIMINELSQRIIELERLKE